MLLEGEQLQDFIRSYEIAFNERLSVAEANELYLRLLNLYTSIKRVADEGESKVGAPGELADDIQM
ncbi:hypothetical protein Q0812_11830 [Brevundimonas sp. 2R-24]|uniref:Uncharacterized protein n=1 Tax=Peiella sedimenti TaxID=3061083 RepID=A0ABT8SP13_9CAUL|nr:hypothetical protein [Caulobacteraceae bacterium XZ-24]